MNKTKRPQVLIAIPMYNCQNQLLRLLEELIQLDSLWSLNAIHVLLIDNRSQDQTLSTAMDFLKQKAAPGQDFTLIQNSTNVGLGGSQKLAFHWALKKGFDYLVVLHGDHQARPAEISNLLLKAQQNPNLAAILGSRFAWRAQRSGYSLIRTLGNRALNVLYSLLSLSWISDLGSGLNLFNTRLPIWSRVTDCSSGFTFNMDLLLFLIRQKASFLYEPISWSETDQVSNARNFKVGWGALCTLIKWRFHREPAQEKPTYAYEIHYPY